MRRLVPFALLLAAVAPARAEDKPLTKAEYDAIVKPLNEKVKQAQADIADADKRIKELRKLDDGTVGAYLTSRRSRIGAETDMAILKGDPNAKADLVKVTQERLATATADAEKYLKAFAAKHADEAKDLVKVAESKEAASAVIKDVNAEINKLGRPPRK
jgi:predicted  nucleic acid-binding Zn-ribbon protein